MMVFDLVKKYVSVYVSGRLISASLNFLTILFLVRTLSASDYGRFALLFGLGNLLSIIFYRCLSQSMLRFYSAYAEKKKQSIQIMSLMLFLLFAMDFIVILVGIGGYFYFQKHSIWVVLVTLLTVAQGHFFVSEALLQAKIKKYFAVSIMALKSVINITMVLVLVLHGFGVYGALSAGILALTIVSVIAWRQCWEGVKPSWQPALFYEVFKYGLMTLMIFGVSYIVGYVDRYLLAFLDGLKDSGIYSAAYDITYQGVNMLLFSVATGIVPLLYRTYENSEREKFKKIFSANALLIASLGSYLCLISIVFFHAIAAVIYGKNIDPAAYYVIPLVVITCFLMSFKAYCLDVLFQAKKALYIILFVFVVMMASNIGLNFLLIPKFQILGAAWAGVVSSFIGVLLTFILAKKDFTPMIPWLDLAKLFFAVVVSVVIGVCFFDVRAWLWITVKFLLLTLFFVACCFLLDIAQVRKTLLGAKK